MLKDTILIVAVALLALPGCKFEDFVGSTAAPKDQYFASHYGSVELQFPSGWYESDEENPYDLQCFSENRQMTTGVFVYMTEDLATDFVPRELLHTHIEDIESKRESFELLEEEVIANLPNKKLTSIVFSGDKGPSKYYYRFTLIEFDENPDEVAVVLQVAIPSQWAEQKPILEMITASAKVGSQKPPPVTQAKSNRATTTFS